MMTNAGLFDMDGSLADYTGRLVADLEMMRSPQEPEITAANLWTAENAHKWLKVRIRLIKAQPNWWLNLPPIEAGLRVFRESEKIGYNNHILTKGPKKHPDAWSEKHKWCARHLGSVPVTVTSDKSLFYGKFLYDDFPDYADAWLKHRPRGLVIMPVTEYNVEYQHPQVVKWDGTNWDEVVHALTAAFNRKHGEPLLLK